MSGETDFDTDFDRVHGEQCSRKWVRTLATKVVASCFVIDMTDTSDVGPEMTLAALGRFHADWIKACETADIPASRANILGASEEHGRLRIWVDATGGSFAAHRSEGSIKEVEAGITIRMETPHSFLDDKALKRVDDEAWGRNAKRWRKAMSDENIGLRGHMMSSICCLISVVCWTYLVSIGQIGWFIFVLTTIPPAIILMTRIFGSLVVEWDPESTGRGKLPVMVKQPAEKAIPPVEKQIERIGDSVFDSVIPRLGESDRPRALVAAAACNRLVDLSSEHPELREFKDDLLRQTRELIRKHDAAAKLLDDDDILAARLIVGIEAMAKQADEKRRSYAQGALDGLDTHVRYLSARASTDDPLSLPTQQGHRT